MKTEGLTEKEAWIAMVEGECVKSCDGLTTKIEGNILLYWSPSSNKWRFSSSIAEGPYSIIEDPSKPVEEVDEVENMIQEFEADYMDMPHCFDASSIFRALNNKINKLKGEK